MRRPVLVAVAAAAVLLAACGGGSGNTSGGSDASQIRGRIDSLVKHINGGDAKAILDDDVPASARRTCSDKDAKDLLSQYQGLGVKLSVKSVDGLDVTGSKASATVNFNTGSPLLPQASVPVPFVKDGGSWKVDTSDTNGCTGIVPTGLH